MQRGGSFLSQWVFGSHALRIGVPLALLWLNYFPAGGASEWTLRIATCLTFLAHGIKALFGAPVYVTMLIGTGHNLLGVDANQSGVETALL